jgi:hypothetical protein
MKKNICKPDTIIELIKNSNNRTENWDICLEQYWIADNTCWNVSTDPEYSEKWHEPKWDDYSRNIDTILSRPQTPDQLY